MTMIYVDGSAVGATGTTERLVHLVDAGHEVILVAAPDHPSNADPIWTRRLETLPTDAGSGAWYLTADPATCGDRRADLRTVLLGPRSNGQRPTRCDATARDLREAVLEVLAADAMSS